MGRPSNLRNDFMAAGLELVGTMFFLLLGLGGIQAAAAEVSLIGESAALQGILYVSTCMGLSLVVSAWVFFRITGSLFNPCVTVALVLLGIVTPFRGLLYFVAQFAGSILAAALLRGLTGPLASNTSLRAGTSLAQGVFIEMFITCALIIAVLMLAAEKHSATPFAPVGIGLTLFACHLFAVVYTGASMNTARSFGPAVISGFPDSHHWVVLLGRTVLGSLLGSAFYAVCKHYQYWTLNPNQDTGDYTKSPQDPIGVAQTIIEDRNLSPRAIVGQISERLPKLSISSGTSAGVRPTSNGTNVSPRAKPSLSSSV
ncbi:aquaporin 1 [Favolaschia claudopus]|uniref:Aquaporin 1 n=1 Tax=Favolaschia claudopus TaxID=2862362 RepID=A0AAW0C499_9AGAR